MWQEKQDEETERYSSQAVQPISYLLPKRWISQNQIEKGSFHKTSSRRRRTINNCLQYPQYVQKKLDEAINSLLCSNDNSEKITRKIVSAYLAGYKSIHIKADKQPLSTKQRHDIKNFVRNMLVGTEIVSDTSAQLVLQVLLSYPELTVQSALRRMTIITKSMHQRCNA